MITKPNSHKLNEKKYLILINPLHRNSIPIIPISGHIGIPKLTMTQQFSDRVPPFEILVVPKIGALPAGDYSRLPVLPLVLVHYLLLGRVIGPVLLVVGLLLLDVCGGRGAARGLRSRSLFAVVVDDGCSGVGVAV